jgi:hypothetical protein
MHIFLLALASATSLALQLLAVVLVILTRPNPKPLLWAFWLSALVVSCASGYAVLAVFHANGTVLGTTKRSVSPWIYLILGAVALAVAVFAATKRGRELIGAEVDKRQSAGPHEPRGAVGVRVRARAEGAKSKAEQALKRGSVWVAIVVGFVLGAPTAFSLAAIGTIVRHGYSLPTQLLIILGFNLVTYIVVEVPIISYAVRPEATAARVQAFADWLSTHKIQAGASLAAVVGVVFVAKGLTAV